MGARVERTGDLRGDVLWEPFPYEDRDEDGPEEDAALPLGEDAAAAVHGVEELHLRHEEWVHGPGGVYEVVASEANETIADELRRDESVESLASASRRKHGDGREDADGGVHRDVVVQVLGGKDGDGDGLVGCSRLRVYPSERRARAGT